MNRITTIRATSGATLPGVTLSGAILALLGLALLSQAASAQSFYRWVDDSGVTHYSESPPEGHESREIRTQSRPSSDQPRQLERLEQRRAQDGENRDAAARAGEEAASRNLPRPDPQYCDQLRQNLDKLENRPIVRMTDPETGQVMTLDRDRRNQLIDETRDELRACE
ncbi:MAG: DUF4124 domain-containing protein [Alcanivorax sp.]|nr:DUF4124 domain-containing protein [Alcanivorax sp.]